MAPLTWRNVNAPNFAPVASMLNAAVSGWESAGRGLDSAFTGFHDIQRDNASSAALPILARVANEQGVEAALNKVDQQVAPNMRSKELLAAMANLRGVAQGYDTNRLNQLTARDSNTRANAEEGREAVIHERGIAVEDQLAGMASGLRGRGSAGPAAGSAAGTAGTVRTGKGPGDYGSIENHKANIFPGESGGDYDALFGHSHREGGPFAGVKLTEMTVNEASRFADPNGEYGQWVASKNKGVVSTPMGAFQVVGDTLRDAAKGLGLTGDEKMTPELQDRIAQWILDNQGTTAWEGYRDVSGENNSGQGRPSSILDNIPENNVVPVDTLLEIAASEDKIYDNRARNADADRERDYNHDRAVLGDARADTAYERGEAEWQRGEAARLLGEASEDYVQEKFSKLPMDPVEARRQLLADTSRTMDERRADVAAYENLSGTMGGINAPVAPNALDASGKPIISSAVQAQDNRVGVYLDDASTEIRLAEFATNPNFQAALEGSMGAEATQTSELAYLKALEEAGLDRSEALSAAQRVATERGVPLAAVFMAGADAIRHRGWWEWAFGNEVTQFDERALNNIFDVLTDPVKYRQMTQDSVGRQKAYEKLTTLGTRYEHLAQRRNALIAGGDPAQAGRLGEINSQMEEILGQMGTLHEQIRLVGGGEPKKSGNSGGGGSGEITTSDLPPTRKQNTLAPLTGDTTKVIEEALTRYGGPAELLNEAGEPTRVANQLFRSMSNATGASPAQIVDTLLGMAAQ